jgi:hypothetical protein
MLRPQSTGKGSILALWRARTSVQARGGGGWWEGVVHSASGGAGIVPVAVTRARISPRLTAEPCFTLPPAQPMHTEKDHRVVKNTWQVRASMRSTGDREAGTAHHNDKLAFSPSLKQADTHQHAHAHKTLAQNTRMYPDARTVAPEAHATQRTCTAPEARTAECPGSMRSGHTAECPGSMRSGHTGPGGGYSKGGGVKHGPGWMVTGKDSPVSAA